MLRRHLRDSHSLVAFAALIAMFLLAGCGGGAGTRSKTVKVTGKVLYKSQPVAGASVAFLGDGKLTPALGRTDAEGRFELTTYESGDGAVPGTHKVTVSKIVSPKAAATSPGANSMEEMAKKAQENQPNPDAAEATSLLPEKYSKVDTANLSFEVKESGTNDFTITLED